MSFFNMEQPNNSLEVFDVSDVSTASCEIFDDSSSTSCASIWHSTPIKKSAHEPKDPAPECTSECSETEIEIFDQSTASGKHCNLNECQIHFFSLWVTHNFYLSFCMPTNLVAF